MKMLSAFVGVTVAAWQVVGVAVLLLIAFWLNFLAPVELGLCLLGDLLPNDATFASAANETHHYTGIKTNFPTPPPPPSSLGLLQP